MNLLVLGKGKMGSMIIDLAQQRGHTVRAHDEFDNIKASMLTPERLQDVDVVIDFTIPGAVIENLEAVARAGKNMVVGTTGWYGEIPRVKQLVEQSGTGFLYAANFSIGVAVFMEAARAAAAALKQGYEGQIIERHHVHKKDAPSGQRSSCATPWSRLVGRSWIFSPFAKAKPWACTSLCWILLMTPLC
jgi:4-hydroxy-tetrahydrodipicolinate reductase